MGLPIFCWSTGTGNIIVYQNRRLPVDFRHRGLGFPTRRDLCLSGRKRLAKGVSIGRKIPKPDQRGSSTAGVNFKDVRLTKEYVAAPPGEAVVVMFTMETRHRQSAAIVFSRIPLLKNYKKILKV